MLMQITVDISKMLCQKHTKRYRCVALLIFFLFAKNISMSRNIFSKILFISLFKLVKYSIINTLTEYSSSISDSKSKLHKSIE